MDGIMCLISNFNCSLLEYKKAIDSCILTFYHNFAIIAVLKSRFYHIFYTMYFKTNSSGNDCHSEDNL